MSDSTDLTVAEIRKGLEDGSLDGDQVLEAELASDSPRKGVLGLFEDDEVEEAEDVVEADEDADADLSEDELIAKQVRRPAQVSPAGEDRWGKTPMQSRPAEFREAPDYSKQGGDGDE